MTDIYTQFLRALRIKSERTRIYLHLARARAWVNCASSVEFLRRSRIIPRPAQAPALELCETLRLVLEPTKASKMKGGYAAGKRINMRAVIP